MPTITDLRSRRDALAAQRSSGVARVSYDGKTVDYRSVAEIDRAIEALDREIAGGIVCRSQHVPRPQFLHDRDMKGEEFGDRSVVETVHAFVMSG